VNPYGVERLVRLLQLLRPPPPGWLAQARRASDMGVLTNHDLTTLGRKLECDPVFRQRFDSNPVGAVEEIGMRGLASRLEREMHELIALAGRIANDDAFRSELDTDPVTALVSAGMPAETAEPFLQSLSVRDEVLAKLPEVLAHRHEHVPDRARLLVLLLGSGAVSEQLRAYRSAT
jgi:putative modified peptide